MKSKSVLVIPYGLPKGHLDSFNLQGLRISHEWKRQGPQKVDQRVHFLVTFSRLLDERFVHAFHEKATRDTRLLVLNDRMDSDRLASRLIDLQIRSAHRFYVAEAMVDGARTQDWDARLQSLLGRLASAHDTSDGNQRILDARVEDQTLMAVSTEFGRLEVPISRITPLAKADKAAIRNFEIDEDGSYIYWPDLDLHLGWEQLQQIVDPLAVQKAKQKGHEFNVRHGAAIRRVREKKGLALSAIPGLSEKQLRRIERGESRLTSNSARKLAAAHGMNPNGYLQTVASALE